MSRSVRYACALAVALPCLLSVPAMAKPVSVGAPIKSMLGQASDSALDKLSQPGAFLADAAIRIVLPGADGKIAQTALSIGDKLGVTDDLTTKLNDAAGLAAQEAKPIFRSAIDNFRLTDAPGLLTKSDGATQYLRKSAGSQLREKVRPLVAAALGKVGAYGQLEKLGSVGSLLGKAGLSADTLTNSVTDQALKGIYTYIGREEANLRKNPLNLGKKLLGGVKLP